MKLSVKHLFPTTLGVATLLAVGSASAALVDAIGALNPGDMYRVVFVTSTIRDATSTDIADYNLHVANAADTGLITNPLGLSWSALASTGAVSAQTNTGISNGDNTTVSFFNTNGDLLATSAADLWDGTLDNSVTYDESGDTIGLIDVVWTGTNSDGSSSLLPLGNPGLVTQGFANNTGDGAGFPDPDPFGSWIEGTTTLSFETNPLYGVSEAVTVVPIPAALPLFLSAVSVVGFIGWKRKQAT